MKLSTKRSPRRYSVSRRAHTLAVVVYYKADVNPSQGVVLVNDAHEAGNDTTTTHYDMKLVMLLVSFPVLFFPLAPEQNGTAHRKRYVRGHIS